MKYIVIFLAVLLFQSCNNSSSISSTKIVAVDSVQLAIENQVDFIIATKDSLMMIPSLRYAKGVDETYTAKMYGKNQITKHIREEQISNEVILGRDYYYSDGHLIFIKEEGSIFTDSIEVYTERLIYFKEDLLYKAYEKHQFDEEYMFDDTTFEQLLDYSLGIDLDKPYRALQQKGEFAMYFDEFLLIDPQSYLIAENKDKSINVALYIIQGDSLLDVLFENPDNYSGKKLWLYHSFKEMSGIERMIYEGAFLVKDQQE